MSLLSSPYPHLRIARRRSYRTSFRCFLKPDTQEEILKWTSNYARSGDSTITIYRDPEAALAKRFSIPDGYKFHGQAVHYPALVLIDPQGREVFRYVGKNNTDRFSFDQLKSKIAELTASKEQTAR
jgi:peroxiredoxin Q/BCP